jgi:pseudouridine kinase
MLRSIPRFARVVVFGGATIDRIGRSDAPAVLGASNPGTVRALVGGVGLNVATILARLRVPVAMVSRVGGDADGERIVAAARAAGIDTDQIGISSAAPTGTYHAAFDSDGGLIVGIADMAVCRELVPAVVAPVAAAAAAGDLWVLDANLPAETIAFLAEEAGATGRGVVALPVSPAKAAYFRPVVDRLAAFIGNRREAAVILGHDLAGQIPAATSLAADLVHAGVAAAIVTDAALPLAVAFDGEIRAYAPLRSQVRSVNGAGDALAAGTLYGLFAGEPVFDAVRHGLAAAALVVEAEGTTRPDLTRELLADRRRAGH